MSDSQKAILLPVGNIYFELTEAFNATQPVVALASGQAVVYYRVAIMSKDGDWVIRETPEACATVLRELDVRRARYRPGAPLDVRWLSGGWSSHFEFSDDRRRRVRCDFLSRPPRVSQSAVDRIFAGAVGPSRMVVVDLDALIAMKQTQRAKDFAVIGELARLLPPEREIELTTDPDRVIALATTFGRSSERPVARLGGSTPSRCARHTIGWWKSPSDSCLGLPPRGFPMRMLSDDDANLRELSDEELDLAWDLWFDLAQTTNDSDPPYSHGVFVNLVTSARAIDRKPLPKA